MASRCGVKRKGMPRALALNVTCENCTVKHVGLALIISLLVVVAAVLGALNYYERIVETRAPPSRAEQMPTDAIRHAKWISIEYFDRTPIEIPNDGRAAFAFPRRISVYGWRSSEVQVII